MIYFIQVMDFLIFYIYLYYLFINHIHLIFLKIFSMFIINFPIMLIINYNMSSIFIFKHVLCSSIIFGLLFYKYNVLIYEKAYYFIIIMFQIFFSDIKKYCKKIIEKIKVKYEIFIFNYIKYKLRKTYLPIEIIYIIEKYYQ